MSIHSSQWQRIRERVLQRDGRTCNWCGESEGQMQVDHIISRARGGEMYAMDNLQTLCVRCHIEKTKQDAAFLATGKTPPYQTLHSLSKKSHKSSPGSIKRIEGDFGGIEAD